MIKIILVIAAHPDDEVLGCGASMAKWGSQGHQVHVLILAEGATSRSVMISRQEHDEELSALGKAAHKAGEILGVASVTLMEFPDNRMDSIDRLEIVKAIETVIQRYSPHTVVTHHSGDVNIDHRLTHEAVFTACRPQPTNPVKRLLAFEVPSSTEWTPSGSLPPFTPQHFEDISKTLPLKLQALKVYNTEMRNWPHPRSMQAVEHLARWRGATVGCEAAEAYMVMRNVD